VVQLNGAGQANSLDLYKTKFFYQFLKCDFRFSAQLILISSLHVSCFGPLAKEKRMKIDHSSK
jgi:hypothetical protein